MILPLPRPSLYLERKKRTQYYTSYNYHHSKRVDLILRSTSNPTPRILLTSDMTLMIFVVAGVVCLVVADVVCLVVAGVVCLVVAGVVLVVGGVVLVVAGVVSFVVAGVVLGLIVVFTGLKE